MRERGAPHQGCQQRLHARGTPQGHDHAGGHKAAAMSRACARLTSTTPNCRPGPVMAICTWRAPCHLSGRGVTGTRVVGSLHSRTGTTHVAAVSWHPCSQFACQSAQCVLARDIHDDSLRLASYPVPRFDLSEPRRRICTAVVRQISSSHKPFRGYAALPTATRCSRPGANGYPTLWVCRDGPANVNGRRRVTTSTWGIADTVAPLL